MDELKVLSVIMGFTARYVAPDPQFDNYMIINRYKTINKCEVICSMKDWLINEGYDVLSGGLEDGKYSCYLDTQHTPADVLNAHYADTEYEAVVKACLWAIEKDK